MPSQEIKEYYDATEYRDVRSDLAFAVNIVGDPKIAIDLVVIFPLMPCKQVL